jgi:hypothetical protein
VVAKGHSRERKRKESSRWQKGIEGEMLTFSQLWTSKSPPQNMKSSSIYRGWKRNVWSPLMPNLDPWFDLEGSQLLAQSSHYGLSGLLQEKGWSGWPL